MNKIIQLFQNNEIVKKIQKGEKHISIPDLTLEALALSSAFLLDKKTIVVVKNNLYNAQRLYERISKFIDEEDCLLFPVDESFRMEVMASSPELLTQRVYVLNSIIKKEPKIIICHSASIVHHLPSKELFERAIISLNIGDIVDIDDLIKRLISSGYEKVSKIDHSLQIARRGGVLDVYSVNYDNPIRIEFFDDEIESIRFFDLGSQRTIHNTNSIDILPASDLVIEENSLISKCEDIRKTLKDKAKVLDEVRYELLENRILYDIESLINRDQYSTLYKYFDYLNDNTYSILNYFDQDTLIYLSSLDSIRDNYKLLIDESTDYVIEGHENMSMLFTHHLYLDLEYLLSHLKNVKYIDEFDEISGEINNLIRPVNNCGGNSSLLKELITDYLSLKKKIVFCLEFESQLDYLKNVLNLDDISLFDVNKINNITYYLSSLNEGFELIKDDIVFISSKEIFGAAPINKKNLSRYKNATVISSPDSLEKGDYVVHEKYGIGQFIGIENKEINGVHRDYLSIAYQNDNKLYVPLDQFALVRKFASKEGVTPRLSKLGGNDWKKTKEKIKNRMSDIADRLLTLYKERQKIPGFAFQYDEELQNEFNNSFPYQLTIDQEQAVKEILDDMKEPHPMDRLLCGDVGFGKTEVAFRAAYTAILNGKQVMLLCPTTLLSRQHYKVAIERFQNFGISIALLNRYNSESASKTIIENFNNHKIDLLIGTHRLLTSKLELNNLGLLVIDEEHRFGVLHKEKIKEIKQSVDVLTLSATPIPRTLQMSLLGIHNLSQIETAPSNRMPVQTYVIQKDKKIIQEIIERELGRNGQVFYLHNNTSDINSVAYQIEKNIPGAKVVVGHGKMDNDTIEDAMMKFYNKEANILVATTIIENGIDIPNANTVIIEDANRFGLAQLYQIRGRVGRSDRLGYAYLLYNPQKEMTESAKKRLKTIKEFTELGSGYRIAMRDLSIRGAGDLIGEEQSGFIDSIGIDLYIKLLNETIEEKKTGKPKELPQIKSPLLIDAYVPKQFTNNDSDTLDLYHQIGSTKTLQELDELTTSLNDIYGKIPTSVALLLQKQRLGILENHLLIERALDTKESIVLHLKNDLAMLDGIGIHLFELSLKISKNIKLDFKMKQITLTLLKKNDHWLLELNKFLEKLIDILEIEYNYFDQKSSL